MIPLANGFYAQSLKKKKMVCSQVKFILLIWVVTDGNYVNEMMKPFRDDSQTLLTPAKKQRLCKIKTQHKNL